VPANCLVSLFSSFLTAAWALFVMQFQALTQHCESAVCSWFCTMLLQCLSAVIVTCRTRLCTGR
jgi:hypothetical protein